MLAVLDDADPYPIKPRIRADCKHIVRPCPYVGCKYHLYLNITKRGTIKIVPKVKNVGEDVANVLLRMSDTCALDVAERNQGMTLEQIGQIMEVSRERIRQIENDALGKIREVVGQIGEGDYDQMFIKFFDLLSILAEDK